MNLLHVQGSLRFGKFSVASEAVDLQTESMRAYAEINLSNLRHNLQEIRKVLPDGCQVMAVVKADAYGHGGVKTAKCLQKNGVTSFAVAEINEAVALRKGGIVGEILILGFTPVVLKKTLIRYRLTQSVFSEEYAQSLCATAGEVKVHVKLDTGMNRLGVKTEQFAKLLRIYSQKRLAITGTYSHLARSDSSAEQDAAFTTSQIHKFRETIDRLKNAGINVGRTHIQSSYGILNFPDCGLRCDLVRPGIALYGVTSQAGEQTVLNLPLRPVLSLRAKVATVKRVKPGEAVGYGQSHIAERSAKIAIISAGYADGYPRNLSGQNCKVLINGQPATVIGNICMDFIMADVTGIAGIEEGGIVTLIGEDGGRQVSVNQLSSLANTINNDILSRIGSRVAKLYRE